MSVWPALFYEDLKNIVRSYLFDPRTCDVEPLLFTKQFWDTIHYEECHYDATYNFYRREYFMRYWVAPGHFMWITWLTSMRWSQSSLLSLLQYAHQEGKLCLEHLLFRYQTFSETSLQKIPLSCLLSSPCLFWQRIPFSLLKPHFATVLRNRIYQHHWQLSHLPHLLHSSDQSQVVSALSPCSIRTVITWMTQTQYTETVESYVLPGELLDKYAEQLTWQYNQSIYTTHIPLTQEYLLKHGDRIPLHYLCAHQSLPVSFIMAKKDILPWSIVLCSQKNLPDALLWSLRAHIDYKAWGQLLRHRKLSTRLLTLLSQWQDLWYRNQHLRLLCYKRGINGWKRENEHVG